MTTLDFYKENKIEIGTSMSSTKRRLFNNFVYENIFIPKMLYAESKGLKLSLSQTDRELIENFAKLKSVAKEKEWRGVDDKKRIKREMTGAAIEYGLLKYYNKQHLFDDSIVDKSSMKNHPDLLPIGALLDIKGASTNNTPLVFKESRSYICKSGIHAGKRYHCPNLIGITDNESVWLLGIASPDVLSTYVDDNLMMIAENSTKTGFYGANELIDIPSDWSELQRLSAIISTKG